jgi:hypothetical protein
MIPEPLGICICGHLAWMPVDNQPLHPCCAAEGPRCEPCRISRSWNRRQKDKKA